MQPITPASFFIFSTALQGPTVFHVIQTSSFVNSTWAQNQGSGWLDDLQILGWDSASGTAVFLKPWSKGNFSDAEIAELQEIFRLYFFGLIREVQERVTDFQLEYPFEIQGIAGCELLSTGSTASFLRGALGGQDFLSIKNHSCVPAPEGGSRAQKFCTLVTQYKGICGIVKKLLLETCPQYLFGILEAGKADLQRRVKPEVWLSSGSSPGPGHLQLVCHVSGFYPKPVLVMWMQGGQEQQSTQIGHILPNTDGTWYLQATLDVEAAKAVGLACRVKHSSLGEQDIILYWGKPNYVGLIILAITGPCLVFLLCLALWVLRRWSYQNIL
ncbi:T-cell surface glycoprotein CD1b [Nannospalax galili]|uniref:T-cell surface glycoprotein CD1b n=1 Tax=Nannospalax galili TaxID=1026970 RepID=UPI0004ED3212|nr:T-cell surface glycoprotein CD1b [Nannospalax galili]